MRRRQNSALCPMRTLACHPSPFALRYRRACSGPTRNIENSSVSSVPLCPLCQTQPSSSTRLCHAGQALGVFFEHRGHRGTEDTEKLRYISSGLSKPFLRYLRTCRTSGRTGVDEASALGRKTTLDRASSQTNGSACFAGNLSVLCVTLCPLGQRQGN